MMYDFDRLVGNNTTIQLIKNSIRNGSFPNFAIFAGIMGTGKSTSSKAVALALTCEHPDGAKACCTCPSCLAAIGAFTTTGMSPKVKIINVAELSTPEDVNSLIKDVFVFSNGNQKRVYVLEEAHTLKNVKGAQTAFLEEIDRMPKDVYVIMCTTEENSIAKELRSRSIVFNFQRLNTQESSLLLDRLVKENHYPNFDSGTKRLIIKHSRGIPRNLENVLEFLGNSDATTEEIKDFMQAVSDQDFIELFSAMKSNDVSLLVQDLDTLCESRSVSVIVSELKQFVLSVLFLFEGGITDCFSKAEVESLKEVFACGEKEYDTELVLQIANEVDRWGSSLDENTFRLHFFKLRLLFQKRTASSVFSGKERVADYERRVGKMAQVELASAEEELEIQKLARVNSKPISSF